jgi:hypothetical protein
MPVCRRIDSTGVNGIFRGFTTEGLEADQTDRTGFT